MNIHLVGIDRGKYADVERRLHHDQCCLARWSLIISITKTVQTHSYKLPKIFGSVSYFSSHTFLANPNLQLQI